MGGPKGKRVTYRKEGLLGGVFQEKTKRGEKKNCLIPPGFKREGPSGRMLGGFGGKGLKAGVRL